MFKKPLQVLSNPYKIQLTWAPVVKQFSRPGVIQFSSLSHEKQVRLEQYVSKFVLMVHTYLCE